MGKASAPFHTIHIRNIRTKMTSCTVVDAYDD